MPSRALEGRLALALAASSVLVACSDRGGGVSSEVGSVGTVLDPDGQVAQFGQLEPSLGDQWGPAGPMGWSNVTRQREDGTLFVESSSSFAHLDLRTATARTRQLELDVWLAEGAPTESCRIDISVNGVHVGTGQLGLTPQRLSIEVPAPAWAVGSNVARLELSPEGEASFGPADLRIALARAAYDVPSSVDSRPGGVLALGSDTAVHWNVVAGSEAVFVLRGHSEGAGSLQLRARPLDVVSGRFGEAVYDATLRVEQGQVERGVPLSTGADPVQVEAIWRGEDATTEFLVTETQVRRSRQAEHPPILFLAIDTLSAQHLSLYGYPRDTSPNLDALAEDSVVFERCITNAPWTLPSFMSVMTGVFPLSHRQDAKATGAVGKEVDPWEMWYLTENRWTLAEELHARGYTTAGFVDNLWITERFGFPQGFGVYDTSAGDIDKLDNNGGIRHVAALTRAWLADQDLSDPFFLFLHCFDVHGPYSPEAPYRGRYREDGLDLGGGEAWALGVHNCYGIVPAYITTGEWPEEETPERIPTDRVHASYDEGIRMTDAEVGTLLGHLKELGLYDDLLIVVFSDHGETMGQGPYYFGHGVLDDAVLRVPLIVKLPGQEHAGRRVSTPVQLVDLYPTVLDLLGAPTEHRALHGRSLVPLLYGAEEDAPRALFSEGGICEHRSVEVGGWKLVETQPGIGTPAVVMTHPLTRRMMAGEFDARLEAEGVRLERLEAFRQHPFTKQVFAWIDERGLTPEIEARIRASDDYSSFLPYLRRLMRGPYVSLYDLRSDPLELQDVSASHPEKLAELRQALARVTALRDQANSVGRFPTQPVQLSAEDLAELARLGYADQSHGD